jgi:predicted enzyme related to lactoylglutathione lyase
MPNRLAHFAIEAADVDRAKTFYESVFGWDFEPWGPPEFYLIHGAGVAGALQKRQAPLPEGRKGFECSFAVDSLKASRDKVETAGGKLLGAAVTIPTVGQLVQFLDTEGNQAILIEYEPERLKAFGWT